LSSAIKDRRKDRAAKYAVPLPKVRGIAEEGELRIPPSETHLTPRNVQGHQDRKAQAKVMEANGQQGYIRW
jgi:hypothetical protein